MSTRAEHLLRLAFLAGAITDATALLPLLWPPATSALWGLREVSAGARVFTGCAASLMLGWTVLLLWAYRRPLERRFVAALTMMVICGLVLTEVAAVHAGTLEAWRMVPTWCLQVFLLALFAAAYCYRPSTR